MFLGYRVQNHPQQVRSRGSRGEVDDRATPKELFDPLHARFAFTVDVSASLANTKCPRFFDRGADGLAQSWGGERAWCNPPYSAIRPWVEKAWAETEHGGVELVVMLLPNNRCEQSWWQDLVEPYRDRPASPLRCEFLRGRPRFTKRGQVAIGPNERPPFGCVLLIWEPTLEAHAAPLGTLLDGRG